MKAQRSPSPSPEKTSETGFRLSAVSFLGNGPYSLELLPGECVGLSGRSGVGKSQLLRAVADVIAHGGDCSLDGKACTLFSPTDWRKVVALVPAESFWWYDTVAPHFTDGEQVSGGRMFLERLGFPSDVMDWQISRLSTGERQRLSLFRTMITGPRVLLLDEPTSALDPRMAQVVEDIVREKCSTENMMCLWVSHDREQLSRVAERVFVVEKAALVEAGEYKEI